MRLKGLILSLFAFLFVGLTTNCNSNKNPTVNPNDKNVLCYIYNTGPIYPSQLRVIDRHHIEYQFISNDEDAVKQLYLFDNGDMADIYTEDGNIFISCYYFFENTIYKSELKGFKDYNTLRH